MEAVNPYQAPEGELVNDADEVGEVKFFSPGCRIGRLRYCAHYGLVTLALYVMVAIAGGLAATMGKEAAAVAVGIATMVLVIASMVLGFIFVAQRLHDLNKSAWMMLLFIIPVVNIIMAIYILFWPGTPGRNNYGAPPPANRRWHWIAGLTMPAVIALIGILAAVAIPAYQDYVQRAQQAQQQ